MKVSICVPIYGVEKYIERCVRSLFEQTYEDLEYIFVNDCTKDKSIEILQRVLAQYPHRESQVHLITHEKNRGLGAARNTAVAAATGEFLFHVDSDDYIDTTTIEKCVKRQIGTGADIVTCNAVKQKKEYAKFLKNKEYDSVKDHCLKVLKRKEQIYIWGRLIRTSLYSNHQICVEEGINMGEDYQVTPRLIYYAHKTATLNEALYYYDCSNETSYSNQFSREKHRQSWRSFDIVEHYFRGKGREFEDAVKIAETIIVEAHLVISAKIEDGSFYYGEARRRLKSIDRHYWNALPLTRRVTLLLSWNYKIMKGYIQIARWINIKKK